MLTQDHVDTIAAFPLFAPVPRAKLDWVATRADDIARRFTHLNDGDLDFNSQPGHTVFRVRLPVADVKASPRAVK